MRERDKYNSSLFLHVSTRKAFYSNQLNYRAYSTKQRNKTKDNKQIEDEYSWVASGLTKAFRLTSSAKFLMSLPVYGLYLCLGMKLVKTNIFMHHGFI